MGLRWIDAVLVVAYLVAILAIGLRFAHRQTTIETYFVAKRSIPSWALGISMLATIISAVTFIAYPGAGYAGNWSLLVPGIMVLLVPALVGVFIIPFYRHVVGMSAYDRQHDWLARRRHCCSRWRHHDHVHVGRWPGSGDLG